MVELNYPILNITENICQDCLDRNGDPHTTCRGKLKNNNAHAENQLHLIIFICIVVIQFSTHTRLLLLLLLITSKITTQRSRGRTLMMVDIHNNNRNAALSLTPRLPKVTQGTTRRTLLVEQLLCRIALAPVSADRLHLWHASQRCATEA